MKPLISRAPSPGQWAQFLRFLLTFPLTVAVFCLTIHSASARSVAEDLQSPSAACPPVQNTPSFTIAYGEFWWDGAATPVDRVVEAVSPRGDVVGCFLVTSSGYYGTMYVYGEDTSVTPAIPGMRSGEVVRFRTNGQYLLSTPALAWSNDRAMHKVDLTNLNISRSGTSLVLSWYGTNNEITRYEVWRSTNVPYFSPGSANTTKLADVTPPSTPGMMSFTNSSVLGNVDINYFYLVRSVSTAGKNSDSSQVGEFEFRLFETTGTDFTWVGLVLNVTGISRAQDLANHIQNNSNGTVSVLTISRWNATGQNFSTNSGSINNFAVSVKSPYRIEIDIPGTTNGSVIWTQVGILPSITTDTYTLYETTGTDFTWILQPLDMTGIPDTTGLAGDIQNKSSAPVSVLSISRWNPIGQNYSTFDNQGGIGNFATRFGYPYRVEVNVNAGSTITWP
jgi:hypothetical protein